MQTTDERADKENMEELIQNNKKQRESNEQSQNKNGRLEKTNEDLGRDYSEVMQTAMPETNPHVHSVKRASANTGMRNQRGKSKSTLPAGRG